jgi:hypothetical protein
METANLKRRTFTNLLDLEEQESQLLKSAEDAARWLRSFSGNSLALLQKMKFEKVGFCPLTSEPLNIIEQLNQTFTTLVVLSAVKQLFEIHPHSEGFKVALGTSSGFDIESVRPNLVVAEAFAATSPLSNGKLARDLKKLRNVHAEHRYIFFACPGIAEGRVERREKYGIKVYSVSL